jgi:hypothetical protein
MQGTMDNASKSAENPQPPVRGIVLDILLNAIVPLILYRLSKRYISSSDLTALSIAAVFPLAGSIYGIMRRRHWDPIAIVVLLGIAASAVALLLGGSARLLLVRESLFTGGFGLACFISLLLPRPMMFYFGRHFVAGEDAERRERFNASWQFPQVRFANRLITLVWGSVYVAELGVRVMLIYTLSTEMVLILSPILIGGATIVTIIWTFSYVRRIRERVQMTPREIIGRN